MQSYPVQQANGRTFLQAVPPLAWGEWKDNTFAGTISAAMQILGKDVCYADVMGITGLCFRFSMSEDWCPGAPLAQHGPLADDETISAALGLQINWIGDAAQRDDAVRRSIDAGRPVMILGQTREPEWGLITGYDADGSFFGRSYFDTAIEEHIWVTEHQYSKAFGYPGMFPELFIRFFDQEREKMSDREILLHALRFCCDHFGDCVYKYHTGEKAYQIFIHGMRLHDLQYYVHCRCDQYFLGMMLDAIHAAQTFLSRYLHVLPADEQCTLQAVIDLYRQMNASILQIIPYEKTSRVFCTNIAPVWDRDTRLHLADALTENLAREKQLRTMIREILGHYE